MRDQSPKLSLRKPTKPFFLLTETIERELQDWHFKTSSAINHLDDFSIELTILTVTSNVSKQTPPAFMATVSASTVLPVPRMVKDSKSRRSLQMSMGTFKYD